MKADLDSLAAAKTTGAEPPSLRIGRNGLVPRFNAWKNGTAPDSPVADDGRRGLPWAKELPGDCFESAVIDLAVALKNWRESRTGKRKGRRVGFPRFKSKRRSTPSFRLRHPAQLRVEGRRVRLPVIGWVRVHDDTRRLRRLLSSGRFKPLSVTVSWRAGRWQLSISGVATAFHPARRDHTGRAALPVGVDRGIRRQLMVADTAGNLVKEVKGTRPLEAAQRRLRQANKALARTKPGSAGRAEAARRLGRIHARVAHLRADEMHKLTTELATGRTRVTAETLNLAAMANKRGRLGRALADQALGELGRQLAYKARWYGAGHVPADRWFPSSQLCSACAYRHRDLPRGAPRWTCPACQASHDRDLNAAVNLARYPELVAARPELLDRGGPPPAQAA